MTPISEWRVVEGFVCRKCGSKARANPEDETEWGCVTCDGSSRSLFINFVEEGSSNAPDATTGS